MSVHYSIKRQSQGLELPFGAASVVAACAIACAIVGLAIPMRWIESISWQLYLDQMIAATRPPLGMTARLLAALALALIGGLAGWLLARLFGVTASDFGLSAMLDRVRGVGHDDEADAPALRAADRHPDAPARRPFSAARDLPGDEGWSGGWTGDEAAPADNSALDADELLLDTQFVAATADDADEMLTLTADTIVDAPTAVETTDAQVDSGELPADDDGSLWSTAEPAIADPFAAPSRAERIPADAEPLFAPAFTAQEAAPAISEPPATPPRRPAPEPLDLSAAPLSDLIARLEAGLSHRERPLRAAASNPVDSRSAEPATQPIPAPAADPAFPQDPELAAALATLRRMGGKF